MALVKKLGCLGLLAATLLAGNITSPVRASEDALDQGSMQSTSLSDPLECRWRHARAYAVITVYNHTDYPITYQVRYTSGGGYYVCTVPAQGWCCHWTTSGSADYRLVVGGREFSVAANWVRLTHRPCHHHGTPVHLGR